MANRVSVSELPLPMDLATKIISLQVKDGNGKLRGYLTINKAYIAWYKGKKAKPCMKIHLDQFITAAEQRGCFGANRIRDTFKYLIAREARPV